MIFPGVTCTTPLHIERLVRRTDIADWPAVTQRRPSERPQLAQVTWRHYTSGGDMIYCGGGS
jgi:hypothetical protein